MTRTISETDIAIAIIYASARPQRGARFVLTEPDASETAGFRVIATAETRADAVQARADIIDERAGSARRGDVVRIGSGKATYRVDGFRSDGAALLYPTKITAPAQSRLRYVDCDRLHAVRVER